MITTWMRVVTASTRPPHPQTKKKKDNFFFFLTVAPRGEFPTSHRVIIYVGQARQRTVDCLTGQVKSFYPFIEGHVVKIIKLLQGPHC